MYEFIARRKEDDYEKNIKLIIINYNAVQYIVTATGFGPHMGASARAAKVQAMNEGAKILHVNQVKAKELSRAFSNNGKECTIILDVTPIR